MSLDVPAFAHEYVPASIHFGRGEIDSIGSILANRGYERALVVCGQHVSANEALMGAVTDGLGDHCAAIFDETTPEKTLETVYDGVDRLNDVDADVVVPVGGGSSLDMGTGIGMLAHDDRTFADAKAEVVETGALAVPDDDSEFVPTVPVPTTMAGADLSVAAGFVVPTEEKAVEAVIADSRLMPEAIVYDPGLYETTPMDVLAGSAINGFDKGIEAIYSRFANPITDATAVRGLRYLRTSLPQLRTTDDPVVMDRAVMGLVLVQYGISIPKAYKINIVHAFGHALRKTFGIQQGVAHAVIVPHALELIFDEGGGRPEVLAEGLVSEGDLEDVEAAVIDSVIEVRDGLGLPSRIRDVEGTAKDGLLTAAEHTYEDAFLDIGPAEFDPTLAAIEETLDAAW